MDLIAPSRTSSLENRMQLDSENNFLNQTDEDLVAQLMKREGLSPSHNG